jgi:hypothetical protein
LPCLIDDTSSPDFVRQRKALEKDFPHISTDLASLYEDIREDYKKVQQAHGVPGYKNLVWKYRCESSDMDRGKSGSFRVLGYYREEDNTMYMISVYPKKLYEQPPAKDMEKWTKNVKASFSSQSVLVTEAKVEICIICGSSLSDDERDAFGDRCAIHRTTMSI